MKKKLELYTQGKNECAITTARYILFTELWIKLSEAEYQELVQKAEADNIWSRWWWTKFKRFFNWFTGWFYKKYWVEIEVEEFDILEDEFKKAIKEWNTFCIWLLRAWSWYKTVRNNQTITMQEMEETPIWWFYGHAQTYKLGYIIWILWSIDIDIRIISLPLEVLSKWVEKWVYWQTARSLKMKDELLQYYLRELKKWTVFEHIEQLDDINRKTLDLALKLQI